MKMCLHYIQETWYELHPCYQQDKRPDYDALVNMLEEEIGGTVDPQGMFVAGNSVECHTDDNE